MQPTPPLPVTQFQVRITCTTTLSILSNCTNNTIINCITNYRLYLVALRPSPGFHRLSMLIAALTSLSNFSPHFGQIQSRVFTSKFSFIWPHLWHVLLVFLASTNTTPSASGLYHSNFFFNLFMNSDRGKIKFCSPPMSILILA